MLKCERQQQQQKKKSMEYKTYMSVLLIVRPKFTLTTSHAAPWWVTDAASVTITCSKY